jgi:hypothetical protein
MLGQIYIARFCSLDDLNEWDATNGVPALSHSEQDFAYPNPAYQRMCPVWTRLECSAGTRWTGYEGWLPD